MGDRLGHHIDYANPEQLGTALRQLVYHFFQLAAQRNDLISVAQHHPSRVSEFQVASDPGKQIHPKIVLQQAQLPADGLWRQVQSFTGPGDTTLPGPPPKSSADVCS